MTKQQRVKQIAINFLKINPDDKLLDEFVNRVILVLQDEEQEEKETDNKFIGVRYNPTVYGKKTFLKRLRIRDSFDEKYN